MAVEPLLEQQWGDRRAALAQAAFETNTLGSLSYNLIWYVSRFMGALILYFGATFVMAGELTVGQLIAFNMIAAQVIAPILRMSQLWQELQQVQVSVARLGDILRTPAESMGAMPGLEPMRGAISLRNVSFRYVPDEPEVLCDVSLEIPVGQVLGIVGPSGSGKSTLSKLLQRLYEPQNGQILIDGIDIARVHPAWVRRQIGVVLQENLLFNRTLHENIALGAPHLTREQVIEAAQLAGADEFITRMPHGYDTVIEERGANLSGGQRQRIAIARALAGSPRILILDEATSAVDFETERLIRRNLSDMARGRTVIIIAHRLTSVRRCDRIIGIDQGRIVEDGTHEELLSRQGGLYRRLWELQSDPG
jgi:subfamily B ATP-binding cassette protein HlyB/CyaB